MKIESVKVDAFCITEAPALDPITVITRDCGPGRGQVIIECFGEVWATFWGGMGDGHTVRTFIPKCNAHYVANCLWPRRERRTKPREAYLLRIVNSVIVALMKEKV